MQATHRGELQGIEPNDARAVLDGMALYRMEEGLIA